ncbi:transglutaminaseTgpA domain-containing protein [Pedococcus sp. NPDC057267]|uniref:transglutaminase family protein n=1 Tax=Pedococcus sp. NPDC057267 TaxID=3346077 RepID=UPI003644806B
MNRGRVADSVLAGLASAVVAWPLTTLFTPSTWIRPTLGMVVVVVVAGILARSLTSSWVAVVLTQLVGVVVAAGWIYGRGHLWHGLPTPDMVLTFNRLLVDARETIQNYAAPAPTNRGITLAIGLAIGAAAILVDHLAVMRRSPALAGLPLLTTFLISASNSGDALNPMYFVAAGGVWLVLLGRQGIASLRRWSTTVPLSASGRRHDDDRDGSFGYAAAGRSLAVAGLAVAVLLPVAIPHLPTRYLIDGLGRSQQATGFSDGQVGLRSTLDLTRSLQNPSKAPVFTYTTNARLLSPLRIGVLETYRDDTWRPDTPDVQYARRSQVDLPQDLGPSVPRETYRVTVDDSRIEAPQIAAPTPVVSGDLGRIPWGLDANTSVVSVERAARSYSFTYLALNPTPESLAQPVQRLDGGLVPPDLQVDPAAKPAIEAAVREVVPKGATRIEAARAIQKYLRTDGGFRYSLQVPDTVRNQFGQLERPDAITLFLRAKVGYCVQFATAMVMMAREAGIPARMAIGYLPGAASRGSYVVTGAEAHAWPELFFEGIGWLRFEPTPSGTQSTVAPPYSLQSTTPDTAAPTGASTATSVPTVTSTRPDGRNDPGANDPTRTTSTTSGIAGWFGGRGATIALWVLLGVLAGVLGSLAVPLAARARRRRQLRHAADEAARVEVEWRSMVERIGDLGVIPPRGSTPRQVGAFYQREAYLEGEQSTALRRVVDGVERARYARPGSTALTDIRDESAAVVKAVSGVRRRRDRLRAVWWPTEGVVEWRERGDALAGFVRRPWDRFQDWRAARRD